MIWHLITVPFPLYVFLLSLLVALDASGWTWMLVTRNGQHQSVTRYLVVAAASLLIGYLALALGYKVVFATNTVYCFARN